MDEIARSTAWGTGEQKASAMKTSSLGGPNRHKSLLVSESALEKTQVFCGLPGPKTSDFRVRIQAAVI